MNHLPRKPAVGGTPIGDVSEAAGVRFTGLPDFAPEILQRVRLDDPMRAKHLRAARSTDPDPDVVIDLGVYARAAATRTTITDPHPSGT